MESLVDISVLIPVTERHDHLPEVFCAYKQALEKTKRSYEFVFVLDGNFPMAYETLEHLNSNGEKIKIIQLAKRFGEATALTVGFENTRGETILTLPPYQQVEAEEIPRLVESLDSCDMVVGRRWPRKDSLLNRLQAWIFHFLLSSVSDFKYHDMGCGVRAMRRKLVDEVKIYGDQHRFLPLLADNYGFHVKEIKLAQSQKDAHQRIYPFGTYIRRILDIFSIFFLLEFTKKPLRFFGILGSSLFALGSLILSYLAIIRFYYDEALANRPLLLLGVLLIVLGIQIFSIGLIGEIIIFIHAKDIKEYKIEKIVN